MSSSGWNPKQMEMMGFGAAGAGLGSLFSNQQNPYNSAEPYLNQIPGMLSSAYGPYMQAGQGAMGQLQGQYGNLLKGGQGLQNQFSQMAQNPSQFYNQMASNYHSSPGYQWQVGQGMNAVNNAAMSGGMAGSPQHQQQAATMTQGLANQDFQNYMNTTQQQMGMGLQGGENMYGMGLQGLQGLNQLGFNAANQFGIGSNANLMNQGNLAYSGQAAQNASQGQQYGNLFGGLASLIPFL